MKRIYHVCTKSGFVIKRYAAIVQKNKSAVQTLILRVIQNLQNAANVDNIIAIKKMKQNVVIKSRKKKNAQIK